jgi:hypothetical protein
MNYTSELFKKMDLAHYVNLDEKIQTKGDGISEVEAYLALKLDKVEGTIEGMTAQDAAEKRYLGDKLLELDETIRFKTYLHLVKKKHDAIENSRHEEAKIYMDVQTELKERLNPLYADNPFLMMMIDFYETQGKEESQAEYAFEQSLLKIVDLNDEMELGTFDKLYGYILTMYAFKNWKRTSDEAKDFDQYYENLDDWELTVKRRSIKRILD